MKFLGKFYKKSLYSFARLASLREISHAKSAKFAKIRPTDYNSSLRKMKHEIPIRIIVMHPLTGVAMKVQKGRDELLPPRSVTDEALVFDFAVMVDLSSGSPNFLGKFAQGPKDARFVYVNSGTLAGQENTCWERRAKLSLMSVNRQQIEQVLAAPSSRLETSMNGAGRDGGPTCAGVKGIEWKVAKK